MLQKLVKSSKNRLKFVDLFLYSILVVVVKIVEAEVEMKVATILLRGWLDNRSDKDVGCSGWCCGCVRQCLTEHGGWVGYRCIAEPGFRESGLVAGRTPSRCCSTGIGGYGYVCIYISEWCGWWLWLICMVAWLLLSAGGSFPVRQVDDVGRVQRAVKTRKG